MAAGGMYDLVGGGFHRYSVDQKWLVPHFEKMLYDNAQLAVTYLHGWQTIGKARYRQVVEQTLGYMLRELLLESGGFASSQDADTDGKEGLTFTWTRSDGIPDTMLHAFEGGRFILRGELDEATRAELFEKREAAAEAGARRQGGRLLERARARGARRVRAGARPAPTGSTRRARSASSCSARCRTTDGRLHRTWRDGVAKGTGYLEDYADVANGLLELHAATGELRWLEEANRLARLAIELFHDAKNGGFFQTPSDGEELVVRRKVFDDSPAPSGNSMLAYVLLRLSRIYGDDELEEKAASACSSSRSAGSRTRARPSAGGSSASTSTSRRGARSRSSARRRATSRARRFAAGIPAR